jgi:hypothetical protein
MRSGIVLLLISGCAAVGFAREEGKRDFAKTIPVTPGRLIRIDHAMGRLSVKTHNQKEMRVSAVIRCSAPTTNEVNDCLNRVQVSVQESGGGAVVRTEYPNNTRNISYAVDMDVTMPDSSPLDLRNRFGSTDVSSLNAPATIVSSNGNVTFLAGHGKHRIENSFGSTEVRNNEGDVAIQTSNGEVRAIDIKGFVDIGDRFANVRVVNAANGLTFRGGNCNVDAENIGGPVNITNSFGKVSVTDAKADVTVQNQNGEVVANGIAGTANLHTTFANISASRVGKGLTVGAQNAGVRGDGVNGPAVVETTFGSVDLRNVQGGARATASNSPIKLTGIGGEVYAKTTFAGVTVADAAGPITVEGENGAVVVEAKAAAACKPIALRTTFGPIRVTIPRSAGYNLAARTTFGRIHTDGGVQVAVSGDIGPDSLNGKIGAGGCELRLNGQNSNIDILGR